MTEQNTKVLFIGGDETSRALFASLTAKQESQRLSISDACDVLSAFQILSRDGIDVLLIDPFSLKINVAEVIPQIRSRDSSVPVILLVCAAEEPAALQALRMGAQDYLIKEKLDETGLVRAIRYAAEWKRTTRDLIRKDSELQAIFRTVPDLYFRLDRDGVILDYRAKRISDLYVSPEFFLGRRMREVLPPDLGERFQEAIQEIRNKGEPSTLEYWLPVNGREQYFEARLISFMEMEVVVLVRNITGQKLSLEELRKNEQFFRTIADSTQDIVFVLTLERNVQYVNNVGARLFERPSSEIIGKDLKELFPEVIFARLDKNIQAVLESGNTEFFEGKFIFPSREVCLSTWLIPIRNNDQKVQGVMGVSRDISDHKKIEENLLRSEQRYRGLIESQQDLIVRVDPEGRFTFVNDAYCVKFGKNRAELIGKTFMPLIHPEDLPRTLDAMKALEEPPYRAYMEQRAMTAAGWRWLEWEDCAIRNAEGKLIEIQGVGRDVTARKETEKALRYRLEFERLVTTLSTRFINLSMDEINHEINRALQEIGMFAEADRSYIFQFSADGTRGSNTHEWCAERIKPQIEDLKNLTMYDFPCFMKKIGKMQTFRLRQVSELPPEAKMEKETFEKGSIKSLVCVPMAYSGRVRGFVGFDSVREEREWTENEIALLKIMGEIFVSTLERKNAIDQLKYQAYHDALTDLPNRMLFVDRLNQAIISARRYHHHAGLILLDVDHFKRINDTLGHAVGDQLLRAVAERLRKTVQETDTVTRLGADEFTILIPKIGRTEDMIKIADRVITAFKAPFYVSGHELFMTCSMGISFCPLDGKDVEMLLKNADTAMYRAKGHGRNNYQLYSATMNAKAFEKLVLETSLRHAIDRNEFRVYYQPQIDLRTGHIVGAEALVRWQHPTLGLVPPAEFIPITEENGLIVELGEWIMRTACAQNKNWQASGFLPLSISVNLSGRQFQAGNLIKMIENALKETGLTPGDLELELTEGIIMENMEETADILRELKKFGVRISIDDFGMGYCSLGYLNRFPIDVLKIDKSFIHDFATDTSHAAIAGAIISMAHSLKLEVVAEGVETERQLSFLRSHGCDKMQGYLFSEPIVPERITELLLEGRGPIARNNPPV